MIPVIPVNNDDRLFGLLNQRGDRRLVYDLTETWPKNGSKISIEFFDDSPWSAAVVVAEYGNITGIDPAAKWIWTNPRGFDEAYCRLSLR